MVAATSLCERWLFVQLLVVHKSGNIDVVEFGEDATLTVGAQVFALDGVAKLVLTEQATVADVVAPKAKKK